jgi:putative membrane protein
MTVVPLIRAEFARLTASKLGIASLIALMTVPLFYGGLYLWGNHDPYGNLKNIPAALVVADTGTYGAKAAKTLIDGKEFDWTRVSASEAASGVRSGKYDFAITFPTDFSKDLSSASGDSPRAASITLTTDDTNSYLSTTIAKQVAESVRVDVAKEVGAKATITLLGDVSDIRSGLVKAQSGASSLADGAASASTGATALSSGLAQLDGQASALPSSTSSLAAAAATTKRYTAQGLAQTKALATTLMNDGVIDPNVYEQLQALGTSVGTADGYAGGVASGAAALAASAPALSSAVHSAAGGAATLADGTSQLASGSSTLAGSLGDAVAKVPATTAAERSATGKLVSDPATVKQDAITQAADYGAGLAPFFLSLSSWIGIYALFLLVRPLSRRALTAVRRPVRTMLAGWLTPALLGVVQMVALFLLVTLALKLPVAQPLGLVAFMAFVALTFAAIVLALNVLLGSVGQFLALIFMVVQLVVAGGTFPWQTLPGPLRALHEVLPMSHAVDGMRQLMYGGLGSNFWGAVLPLLLWLAGSLVVAFLGARRQGRFRTLRELRPSAIAG